MKVLFHAYDTCCQTESGGVQVRIRRIKSLLESRGIQVDFFDPYNTNLRDYDILHIFMLRSDTVNLIRCAKTLGLKVVLSSIVTVEKSAWHIRINRKLTPLYLKFGFMTTDVLGYLAIHNCDYVIAESPSEKSFICKYYNYNPNSTFVIPNGVDEIEGGGEEIFKLIGKKCRYVLQVGRIDINKNLLNTIKAVKGADYDLVIIGGEYSVNRTDYYSKCINEAKGCPNIHFLGWLKSESPELLSAYHNAQALILPSFHETFGLAATEAAIAGCHVCVSNTLPILDFDVFDKSLSFNPRRVSEMRKALDKAMNTPKNDIVRSKALSVFSWDRIIDEHLNIYRKCVQ